MKIGIAGAGGIGSNVAVNLVRSGIDHLKIVDFDRVESSNLNRQFYFQDQIGRPKVEMLALNLKRINPGLLPETLQLRLNKHNMAAVFDDCDIVVEGFDDPLAKKALLEALAPTGQPVVSACGVAGHDLRALCIQTMGHCTIAGDFTSDCRDTTLYAHKVLAVAAMMTDIILHKGGFHD